MAQSRIVVLVIQYGPYEALKRCLDALLPPDAYLVDVCVVDNNTGDTRDKDFYSTGYPAVLPVFPHRNLGFAGGCNAGIETCMREGYEFFFIQNNDAHIEVTEIVALAEKLESNTTLGLIGPKVCNDLNGEAYLGLRIDWTRGKTLYNMADTAAPGEVLVDVDVVEGCGMMIPRRVLNQIERFDERFFLYWEDSDFSMRVRAAGFRTVVAQDISMGHSPAQSTGQDSPLMEYYMTRNALLFFWKHTTGLLPRARLLSRLLISRTTSGYRRIKRDDIAVGEAQLVGVLDFMRRHFGKSLKY